VAAKQTAFVDAGGQLGWLRYGAGDWRTGWTQFLQRLVEGSEESLEK
jgi:hypothetical protein